MRAVCHHFAGSLCEIDCMQANMLEPFSTAYNAMKGIIIFRAYRYPKMCAKYPTRTEDGMDTFMTIAFVQNSGVVPRVQLMLMMAHLC